MKRKNKFLTFLVVMLLIFSILFIVACRPPEETEEEEPIDETGAYAESVVNGTFGTAKNSGSANAYLKDTVTGWTKTNAATYYSNANAMGVIDLKEDKFRVGKSALLANEDLVYPGIAPNTPVEDGEYVDTNAVVIGLNATGSVYYRTTSGVTVEKNKLYCLSIDVHTQIFEKENDLQGAYIVINGGAYSEFYAIDTSENENNEMWSTYKIYIEGNNFEDRTFYVELWLGHGSRYIGTNNNDHLNPRLTSGYIFFDNIVLHDMEDLEGGKEQAKAAFDDLYNARGECVYNSDKWAVLSLIYPDAGFTYYTKYSFISPSASTSQSYYSTRAGSANNYTMTVGKENISSTDGFPTYTSYTPTSGIFDMSKFYDADGKDQYNKLNSEFKAPYYTDFYDDVTKQFRLNGNRYGAELNETTAMLIYHPNYSLSGVGYKSNVSYLIEKNKYYAISVWAYVWIPPYEVAEPVNNAKMPDVAELTMPNPDDYADGEDDAQYQNDYADYLENQKLWKPYYDDLKAYNESYSDWSEAKKNYNDRAKIAQAEFRLSGATIETKDGFNAKTSVYNEFDDNGDPLGKGVWEQLTIYVKGNELSNRNINLEFWYGEGDWGSDGLYPGGAIFDNIEFRVTNSSEGYDYKPLSPFEYDELNEFKFLQADEDYIEFDANSNDNEWVFEFINSKTNPNHATAAMISGNVAADEELWQQTVPDGLIRPNFENSQYQFNLLMLYNKEKTATTLTYWPLYEDNQENSDAGIVGDRRYININANSFYRFSFWLKTDGILDEKGLTATLYDDTDTSLSSLSTLNTKGEWTEVVFYIRGSSFKSTSMYVQFQMGTGDLYTPDNHIKGVAYITAMTFKSIKYSEFNSANTGTYVGKKTISNEPSTSNTITNGYFADLSTSNYDTKITDVFDKDSGELVGVAVPNSWTVTSAVNGLTAPTNLKIENNNTLTWKEVEDATQYYVYMDGVKWPDPDDSSAEWKTRDNVLVAIVTTNSYDIQHAGEGLFKVKAVNMPATQPARDEKTFIGISGYSSTCTNTATAGALKDGVGQLKDESVNDLKNNFGVIDYINYSDYEKLFGKGSADRDRKDFYRTLLGDNNIDPSNPQIEYISTKSDYLMMLSSDYYTRGGYTASSTSLSANSYYMLSVWVKTMDGGLASVTINNTSKVFAATEYSDMNSAENGDYVGYVNIDTKGDWVQYRFYIQTSVTSASIQLELFLGNKYAVSEKAYGDDGKVTKTVTQGLSMGTVFFDDVSFVSMTEEAYNKAAYGTEKPDEVLESEWLKENYYDENGIPGYVLKDLSGEYFANNYIFKLLDYTTDSFDLYTEVTNEEQGHTPKDYTHYVASGGNDYDSDLTNMPMLYGVVDARKINSNRELVRTILDSATFNEGDWLGVSDSVDDRDDKEALILNFLKNQIGTGNNYLLMANLTNNGQYYVSSSYFSVSAESYYKITFQAKTLLPAGTYAQFRLEFGDDVSKYQRVRITSEGKKNGMNEYSFYVYNSTDSSISNVRLSFHLGYKDSTTTAEYFVRGLMVIDNVAITKLNNSDEYDRIVEEYDGLSDEAKATVDYGYYKFVPTEEEEEEPEPEPGGFVWSTQFWLMISSIIIGGILIAVIAVLTWRRIKKRLIHTRAKEISNVPVNMLTADDRKAKSKDDKKDIRDESYDD